MRWIIVAIVATLVAACAPTVDRTQLATQVYDTKLGPSLEQATAFMAYEVVSKGGFPRPTTDQTTIFRQYVRPKVAVAVARPAYRERIIQILLANRSTAELQAMLAGGSAPPSAGNERFIADTTRANLEVVKTVFTENEAEFVRLGYDPRFLPTYIQTVERRQAQGVR